MNFEWLSYFVMTRQQGLLVVMDEPLRIAPYAAVSPTTLDRPDRLEWSDHKWTALSTWVVTSLLHMCLLWPLVIRSHFPASNANKHKRHFYLQRPNDVVLASVTMTDGPVVWVFVCMSAWERERSQVWPSESMCCAQLYYENQYVAVIVNIVVVASNISIYVKC